MKAKTNAKAQTSATLNNIAPELAVRLPHFHVTDFEVRIKSNGLEHLYIRLVKNQPETKLQLA